jgi:hypothetical protein
MENEVLLPCSQQPSTGPCPETKQSGPYRPIIENNFNIMQDFGLL